MTPIDERVPRQDDNIHNEHTELEKIWGSPGGVLGWFQDLSHQAIGKRYLVTAFVFLLLGGIEALLMRIQLARPENHFLTPDQYNQIFTTHGSTMMFLFAVPIMQGFGIYLVPLMLGTRDLAFPRLNAYGYYLYLFGGVLLYAALFSNTGPDAGWFAYTPLSGPEYSPGASHSGSDNRQRHAHEGSGHVDEPSAAILLVDAGSVGHGDLRDACRDDRQRPAAS
jgi:cytochrome c oxidase subunit 1